MTDETDLVEEAYFDINAFMASRGLIDTKKIKSYDSDYIPDFIIENEIAKVLPVPQEQTFGNDGSVLLAFTTPIFP